MEQNGTQERIRVAAQLEQSLVALIDQERRGRCSRAAIVRMALLDRYQAQLAAKETVTDRVA